MNGNYKLIDLKNIEIKSGSTGATIAGVYDAIDKATMPVKVINVNKNGTKLVANFGQGVRKFGGNYYVDLGDGTELKVTEADKVTYANKSGGSASVETGVIVLNGTATELGGEYTVTPTLTNMKDINSLRVTIVENSVAVVTTFNTPFVPVGGTVYIHRAAVLNESDVDYDYDIVYAVRLIQTGAGVETTTGQISVVAKIKLGTHSA